MPDPGLSQANFDLRTDRLAILLATYNHFRSVWKWLTEERVFVMNVGDNNSNFDFDVPENIELSGIRFDTANLNIAAGGLLYVRAVANGGNWDISLYKATGGGGGDLVADTTAAHAGGVADGATGTLGEQNSSGISGTVKLGSSVSGDTTDDHRLYVRPSFKLLVDLTFDKGLDRDGDMERELLAFGERAASQVLGVMTTLRSMIETLLALQIGPAVKSGSVGDDLTILDKTVTTGSSGATSVAARGVVEDLRIGMKDNSTAQTVEEISLSVGAASFDSSNIGAGSLAATATVYEHQEPGTFTFLCVDDTIGSEQFEMKFSPSDDDRAHLAYTSSTRLTVKEEYKDPGDENPGPNAPKVGLKSVTLNRTVSTTDTSSGAISQTASDWSTTGEDADNTDDGSLYLELEDAGGSTYHVKFYSDSGRTNLVAQASSIAASTAFTATEQNRSGLTVIGKLGASPADTDTETVDLQVFKTENSDGVPDRFEITVTRSTRGLWQELWAEIFGWYMNSTTASSETIADTRLERIGPLFK